MVVYPVPMTLSGTLLQSILQHVSVINRLSSSIINALFVNQDIIMIINVYLAMDVRHVIGMDV